MDYHVFLLSRIKERYDQTGDNTDSVALGVRSTARIITGAALIMVAVFAGFAIGDLVMFQQMGFGLAVAVLLDATVVRSVLVPAGMKLLGDWNWYLPRWLGWLPRVQIERAPAVPERKRPPLFRRPRSGDQRCFSRRRFQPARRWRVARAPARRFPVGPGDTPLPAGTSTART